MAIPPPKTSRIEIRLPVSGMTCKACEVRVAKALKRVDGVDQAKANLAKGEVTVIAARPVGREKLDQALQAAGYELGRRALPVVSADRSVWLDAAIGTAVMVVLLWGAAALGLTDLTNRLDASTNAFGGALALVFALGVVASVSTCMALVGGLVLSVSARFAKAHPGGTAAQRLRPQWMFNLGRVVGFGVLGAGLGALGSSFQLNAHWLALTMIIVGLVMGLLGLRLTELAPRLSRFTLTLPAAWGAFAQRAGDPNDPDDPNSPEDPNDLADRATRRASAAPKSATKNYRHWATAALGAASFFLPCGFTQAVQVYALASGSPVRAGAIMAVFALGTTPGLVAIGALGSLGAISKTRTAVHLFRLVGVAVCAFALVNLVGAAQILRPSWFAGPPAPAATVRSDNVTDYAGYQVVRTIQDGRGYTPRVATVYVDRPVRWEVDSQALSCTSSMNLEAMGLGTVNLQDGVNVFEFTPTAVGTLHYTCGMGMAPAQIDVIEAPPEAG
ncbi:MAG: sulfite exporter TauE/SafE family protein [Bifidobacteriaceae bacterium]|nr:sulfite exporter TauE/SafE family protein [Bifidobacteriaceae bacterium]